MRTDTGASDRGVLRRITPIALPLLGCLLLGTLRAEELFSARCTPALTKGSPSWAIADAGGRLEIDYADAADTKFHAVVSGADAERLRGQVASLELTQADVEILQSRSVIRSDGNAGDEVVILRPFDGAVYQFLIRGAGGLRRVSIDNPDFDLMYHPQLKETARLKVVLDLLEVLKGWAKAGTNPKPADKRD